MSQAVLDRGDLFSSPLTDWYQERPFRVAFVLSVLVHGLLIAVIPGFRSVTVDMPTVLNVEIVLPEPPRSLEKPLPRPADSRPEVPPPVPEFSPPPLERAAVEPILRPDPRIEPLPEPVLRAAEAEVVPVPRTEIRPQPRPEPRPEPVVLARPEPRPEPLLEPKTDFKPEPRVETRIEPLPVARVQPRLEPRPEQNLEPRPEPRPEPRTEVRTEPSPQLAPPPVDRPQIEPRREPRPVLSAERQPEPRPAPRVDDRSEPDVHPGAAAVVPPAPPRVQPIAVAPVERSVTPVPALAAPPSAASSPVAPRLPPKSEVARNVAQEEQLKVAYGQSISKEIKRYLKYPPVAQRRGWQGTAEVLLQMTADGKVAGISIGKSSGQKVLDDEALDMVRRAMPLPQAPQDLRGRDLTVRVPIVFKLES